MQLISEQFSILLAIAFVFFTYLALEYYFYWRRIKKLIQVGCYFNNEKIEQLVSDFESQGRPVEGWFTLSTGHRALVRVFARCDPEY